MAKIVREQKNEILESTIKMKKQTTCQLLQAQEDVFDCFVFRTIDSMPMPSPRTNKHKKGCKSSNNNPTFIKIRQLQRVGDSKEEAHGKKKLNEWQTI